MPAPSKSWVVITDGQTDADSPLDTTLVTALRDDLVHLEEWLGDGYTAAKDHDHDGVNSKSVVLGDAVIKEAKLARTSELAIWDDFLFSIINPMWTISAPVGDPPVPSVTISDEDNGAILLTGFYNSSLSSVLKPFRLSSGKTLKFITKMKREGSTQFINNFGFYGINTNNKIWFETSDTANCKAVTTAGGVSTTTTTDVAIPTSYTEFEIRATPTSVEFYIGGILKATHTTNIPTVNFSIYIVTAGASGNTSKYDYIYCHQERL